MTPIIQLSGTLDVCKVCTFFKNKTKSEFSNFFQIFTRFFTRCRVCLQNVPQKQVFFFSLSLTIEPDSVQSERDMSSEDSPPEKPVNGKHTSILPSQVPSHLLMISILEHLCQMYGQDAEQGKKLFQGKN